MIILTKSEIFTWFDKAKAVKAVKIDPKRVNRALGILQSRDCEARLEKYRTTVAFCNCPDSHAGNICKHRIARMIQTRALQERERSFDKFLRAIEYVLHLHRHQWQEGRAYNITRDLVIKCDSGEVVLFRQRQPGWAIPVSIPTPDQNGQWSWSPNLLKANIERVKRVHQGEKDPGEPTFWQMAAKALATP